MDGLAAILEALAEPRRQAIVDLLAGGERCLCDISGALGVSDQLASHHVKRLREARLVQTTKRGQWLYCRLDPDAFCTAADALKAYADRARLSVDTDTACCGPVTSRPRGD